MTQRALYLLAATALAVGVPACGGRDATDGGTPADGAGADAGRADGGDAGAGDGGGTHALGHYAHCTSDGDCPVGDSCSVPAVGTPVSDPSAPRQCRPPCTTDADCSSAAAISGAPSCDTTDHFCEGYCAESGFIPPCVTPATCHVFVGFHDGYCVRP